MVTIPTIAEIKQQILDDIESADTSKNLLPKAVWRILATALAGVQYLAYKLALWLFEQIFTLTMSEAALVKRASEYGITRTPATIWQGTGTATGIDGTVIASGKIATYNNFAYEIITGATISGGTATVTLKSLEKGDDLNRAVSDELGWSTPLTGLDSVLTIASTTQEAEDEESVAALRIKLLNRQRNQPQGGAFADFIGWALEVAGIAEAFVERPTPGYVNVYPLTDEADPVDRIPSAPKLTEVEDFINSDTRYPFGRPATVIAMTELVFKVDFSNLSPDSAGLRTLIETATDDYLYSRRPQQYTDDPDPINEVSAGEIVGQAIAAGAKQITVVLKNAGDVDISDTGYELEISELAEPGTYTWA